jgi:cell wall-associated NlpC family hydrolase
MSTTTGRHLARALALAVALLVSASLLTVSAPQARATTTPGTTTGSTSTTPTTTTTTTAKPRLTAAQRIRAFDARVLKIVSSRRGSPYVYGASGPHRFDCSGLTMWTFRKLGRHLPHSAAAQYGRVKHVRASQRRLGDLVFFHDGGGIYHVGIYAGRGSIWHAPYTGARVRKEHLWTGAVYYGRIR